MTTTLVAAPERSRSRPSVSRSSGSTWVTIGSRFSAPFSTSRIAVGNVNAVTYDPRTVSERSVIVYWWIGGRACLVLPEEHDPPAERGVLDGGTELAADRVDDDVGAVGEQLPTARLEVVRADDDIRSDGRGDRPAIGLRLDHDHRPGACSLEHREEQAADRAGPEDDRRLAGPRVRLVHAVHDARERFDQRGDPG